MSNHYTMGIDIGSTASKTVILKNGQEIVGSAIISVGAGTSGPKRSIAEALSNANISADEIAVKVGTGYGRNSLEDVDEQMSELSCHAKGANFLFPELCTLIDIGGQDVKALKISSSGKLMNFAMNDKCAAGTGRFLDVIARVLELDVTKLAEISAESKKRVEISSTCTVFAESEVISHLSKGESIADIVAGIHRSVASRVGGLVKRIGVAEPVAMTGGVAQNKGVIKALEDELKVSITTTPLAQLAGAIGAALYGYERIDM